MLLLQMLAPQILRRKSGLETTAEQLENLSSTAVQKTIRINSFWYL